MMTSDISRKALIEWLSDKEQFDSPCVYRIINALMFGAFPSTESEGEVIGTEILAKQLMDEVSLHAKTSTEAMLLRAENKRLRMALEKIKNYYGEEGFYGFSIANEALSPHREEVESWKITLRPELQWFAEQMELVLRLNDHKGGWNSCDHDYLMDKLHEEVEEIHDLEGLDVPTGDLINECADVANIAMMIADNARRSGIKDGREEA